MSGVGVTATGAVSAVTRRRVPLLIGAGILVVLVVVSVLTRDSATFANPLDPRNPGPDGAQAVARVLAAHSTPVDVVRGQDALLATPVDSRTTVVVTDPGDLGTSTLDRLREHTQRAGALVVAGPAGLLGDLFDLGTGGVADAEVPAGCDGALLGDLVVRPRGATALSAGGCFGTGGGSLLVRRGNVWLLSAPETLSNAHVLDADNAALALRLLGQHQRVLWYVADSADTAASDGVSISGLLPRWFIPALSLLLAALLTVLLWRARRLGPLVTEPLPVVVRAVESTQSRGRLYRRTGDRDHAAAVLTVATRRRLLEVLRLPRHTSTPTLAAAVAARTGRDPRAVHDLLTTSVVTKDTRLVELGQQLIDLENEVRTP